MLGGYDGSKCWQWKRGCVWISFIAATLGRGCLLICFYRIEKERNQLKSEVDDAQSQLEHVQKGKVNAACSAQAHKRDGVVLHARPEIRSL